MGARRSARPKSSAAALPPLLPKPKRLARRPGAFRLEAGTPIWLPAEETPLDRRLLVAAEQARSELQARTGLELKIERPATPTPGVRAIRCRVDASGATKPREATARDAYRLRVRTREIEIVAPSVDGLRHGLQTLCQLARANGTIDAVDVVDQPDFRDRGVMLDVSRGKVPTRATLEGLVDLCSRLRLNVLMLYVEHTFDFRRHPEIGRGSSPLDAETLLALDAYAADRGVELVPCLQSLGHMERVLSIDRYADLAESDRLWSVSPSRPETYDLLRDLYDEFLPLFRSSRFNANCDEPFDLGRGQSAARAPRKTPGRLFTEHVSKLAGLAGDHGKQLMIWADFPLKHPAELAEIDREVVLLDWWYEAHFDADRIRKLRRKGFEVWACPGTSSWNCLFPRTENALANVSRWADAGRRHRATGLLNTDWGDFGHYNALGVSLQSYAWGAQESWSGPTAAKEFDRAFARHVFGDDKADVARLYRRLGSIHDAGFAVANGSALQYLYFDPIGRSFFLQHAQRRALESSRRRVERVLEEIDRQTGRRAAPRSRALQGEPERDDFISLARGEIAWAADATRLAIDKGLAVLDYDAWRRAAAERGAKRLPATGRSRLARRLESLAAEQGDQLGALETLWLSRSAISDFETVRKRIRLSIRGLRDAASRLRRNAPPRPPATTQIGMLDVFNEVRRATGMRPR